MGKYLLKTVKPNIDTAGATAYTIADILFDWHAFEIPKGGCILKHIQLLVHGTNGVAANELDMDLVFAKSIDGVAPPSLGTVNGGMNNVLSTAAKNHIIGYKFLDGDRMNDTGNDFVTFNLWSASNGVSDDYSPLNIYLDGEEAYTTGTQGYQTLWVAAIAQGAFDFGTGVIMDGSQAAAVGTQTQLSVTSGGLDPDIVFAKGDELIAQDGALIGNVVSVDSSTALTVDQVQEALANSDELCFRQPIRLHIGIQY